MQSVLLNPIYSYGFIPLLLSKSSEPMEYTYTEHLIISWRWVLQPLQISNFYLKIRIENATSQFI
jgi:hypothetical protein